MAGKRFKDLLSFVQKPSRYLGTEVNRIVKDPQSVDLKMVLAFPDLYDIGTSHFGIQILYHLLNEQRDILAERVFAPGKDMETLLRRHRIPLPALESGRPIDEFDIIGFSLLYELNYTNILNMLDLGGIPVKAEARSDGHPIVVAGGPAVCNPEPMADFFDAMVFGDGEGVILELARAWIAWKKSGGRTRGSLLEAWSQIEGVYIPRFFQPRYNKAGFQELEPTGKSNFPIKRAIAADLDQAPFPDRPIIPFGKPVHDRLRLEISRGCSRGCRFCQAGMIYRPVRERSAETIMALIKKSLGQTGYEDLSLLSLSTGDYACLTPLMECLMQLCRNQQVSVSLPSLRAGSLTPELMELIRSVRKTGFTIAPEAGSQRLRDVINKNITFKDVEATVKHAFQLGWHVIKLYFMIGLPGETGEDLDAIVEMVRKLKQIKGPTRRKRQVNVSITTFVPKPHTPFQWAGQISLEASRRKIAYLKKRLNIPGVQVKWQKPEMSLLEGILARGDRRIGALIHEAWKSGCTFDGWNDLFEFDLWRQALEELKLNPDDIVCRERDRDEPLPWQHMDAGIDSDFLKKQWQAAFDQETISDCRFGDCHACGVCDFAEVEPKVFESCSLSGVNDPDMQEKGEDHVKWLSLKYTKLGNARFFGHLELSHIFSRAIRRAGIGIQYSRGFHPMPKLSFDDPLPLGIESEAEEMRLLVSIDDKCREIIEKLNRNLPAGVRIVQCLPRSEARKKRAAETQTFSIHLNSGRFDPDLLDVFRNSPTWPYEKINQKGRRQVFDLRKVILNIKQSGAQTILYETAPNTGHTVRPSDVIVGIFRMSDDLLKEASVVKLVTNAVNSNLNKVH